MQFQQNQSFQGYPPQQPQSQPNAQTALMMPPDLAAMQQQGYAAQQAQLAAIQQRQAQLQQQQQSQQQSQQPQPQQQPSFQGIPPQMQMQMQLQGMGMQIPQNVGQHGMNQQQQMQQMHQQQLQQQQIQQQHQQQQAQQAQQGHASRPEIGELERMQMQAMASMPPREFKVKRGKPQKIDRSAAGQTLGRHTNHLNPPPPADLYRQQAMTTSSIGPSGPPPDAVEPWADALDEIDHRELAMGRFRARQEVLGEVFGPEPIRDIPLGKGDPWEGLGMDGETLEAKVLALERENQELERRLEGDTDLGRRSGGLESGATGGIMA